MGGMKTVCTRRCAEQGHPEIRLEYDSALALTADALWLSDALEMQVAGGERYQEGETFQVGWALTRFVKDPDGLLSLEEPDMASMPIQWQPGVTRTLAHLRRQRDVVASVLGTDVPSFPSLMQSCLVCTRVTHRDASVMMAREVSEGNDSGWYIGCMDARHDHNDPKQLKRVSLYEAIVAHAPQAVGYLALPPGATAIVGKTRPVIRVDNKELAFIPGSYLATRYKAISS